MRKEKNKVVVVGAGAAGMMAAIEAARTGAEVLLIERNSQPGKKLATTGNGRCNFTNLDMEDLAGGKYRGQEPKFAEIALKSFGPEKVVDWFRSVGIEPKYRGTYVYPYSDQAVSVVSALWDEAEHLGVEVLFNTLIRKVRKDETAGADNAGGFLLWVEGSEAVIKADKLILATGSKAAPKTGSTGDGYVWAKALGHTLVPQVPALTAIKCKGNQYRDMAGVRTDAGLSVKAGSEIIATEEGELQLTDYGISGIPVFQISRYVAYGLREGKDVSVYINFLPHISDKKEDIYELYKKRAERLSYKDMGSFFTGLLNQKLGNVILQLAHIDRKQPVGKLSKKQLDAISSLTVSYKAECAEVNPFANAQCAAGGISTTEVSPYTMESRIVKCLYFAGEILDIDGICGGYNLQWAWSSGYLAGRSAGNNA